MGPQSLTMDPNNVYSAWVKCKTILSCVINLALKIWWGLRHLKINHSLPMNISVVFPCCKIASVVLALCFYHDTLLYVIMKGLISQILKVSTFHIMIHNTINNIPDTFYTIYLFHSGWYCRSITGH